MQKEASIGPFWKDYVIKIYVAIIPVKKLKLQQNFLYM